MKSKLIFTSLLATALISPGRADATCFIQEARLQQISEREILAIIDGYCTREYGETGYYTQIGPDTYGEVMAVYGDRNIDNNGRGFSPRYGFNVVFPTSAETYRAGVWIGDADGVTHSAEMSISNSFYPTTTTTIPQTTTTTVPQTTTTVPQPVVQPVVIQQPVTATETTETPTTTTSTTSTIVAPVISSSAKVVVQIIKPLPKKKVMPKCSSRLKSCKLPVAGATRTTGPK